MKLSLPFGLFSGREDPPKETIPGKALLWLIAAFAVLLVPQWDRLPVWLIAAWRFTVDTAASFFVLAVGLKWLETRSARDFYVLFFILVYLATVNFLFRQDILWALVNFAAIALLLVGLQTINAPDLSDAENPAGGDPAVCVLPPHGAAVECAHGVWPGPERDFGHLRTPCARAISPTWPRAANGPFG